jgi:hypothetical protein
MIVGWVACKKCLGQGDTGNERWRYRFLNGIGRDVNIEFVDKTGSGDFPMTMDPANISWW